VLRRLGNEAAILDEIEEDEMELVTEPWAELFGWDTLEWGMLPVRLVLGTIFLDSGLGKWRRGISGTGDWFASLGFPFAQPTARAIATLELVGGLLLILGLGVHWVALPLAGNMVVATYVQRFKLGAPFQGGDVQGYELDVLMVAAAVTLVLTGAGPISLDALLGSS
jgi:putative oxidoreductase